MEIRPPAHEFEAQAALAAQQVHMDELAPVKQEAPSSLLPDQNMSTFEAAPALAPPPPSPREALFKFHIESEKERLGKKFPLSVEQVSERVDSGEKILEKVMNSTYKTPETKESHLQDIINLQWALYERAVHKDKQGFSSGNMILQDPERKLFEFMNNYKETYGRKFSTHFKGEDVQKKGMENRGIDLPDNLGPILPGGKRHILFGGLENGTTFAKWEIYGTKGIKNKLMHLWALLKTRGKQELAGTRKEHTPKDVKAKFQEIIHRDSTTQLTPEQKKQVKNKGIRGMMELLPSSKHEEFKQFLAKKGYDNLELRKGNEVVLGNNELLTVNKSSLSP